MRLEGKVAIVTGGSVGIGAAIAKRYASEGATVATVYKSNDEGAAGIIKEIEDAGGKGKAFKSDVSKVELIEKLIADVIAEFGRVDILVNNAGVFRTVPVMETTEEIWDEQLDLNLKGYFFMVKTLVPHFRENGGGKVVNISSIAGTGRIPELSGLLRIQGWRGQHDPCPGRRTGQGEDQRELHCPGQCGHAAQRASAGAGQ